VSPEPASGSGSGSGGVTGLVVIDKEAGWTSHDVVARCRRIFGQRRVGHAGTLDPDATGVLLVGLGRATRLMRFLTALPKTYTTDIVLGAATSTLDASGEVLATYDMSHVTSEAVAAAAAGLTGEIDQVPPMVSAVKVDGRRLHELARKGLEVERPARTVTVSRFDTAPDPDPTRPGVYRAEVVCSSGTYIRVLAQDLGRALGGDAYVTNLRRTNIGSFGGDDMRPLDSLGPDDVLTPAQAMRDMDAVTVPPDAAGAIRTGLPLDRVPLGAMGDGPWAMLDETGDLLAVYEATGSDRIRPAVVLAGPGAPAGSAGRAGRAGPAGPAGE
jgi:tRNA pseudouridine55 synthase